jgi:uncharacterized Fe-S center protein
MSEVLFASASYERYDSELTLPAKFGRMIDEMNLAERVKGKATAVKMHLGRGIGYTTIHPLFVKILIDKLKGYGARVYITDQEIDGARARGYTEEYLGCPIVHVCGLLGKYIYTKELDFKTLKHIDIGGHIRDAEFLLDLSHGKGHGACGFGGACKNIAMGCVTDRTRSEIHGLEGGLLWDEAKCTRCELCLRGCNHNAISNREGKISFFYHHCTLCQHCVKVCPSGAITLDGNEYDDFQKGMALCTKEVLDTFGEGDAYYINFLMNITALCDCWGLSTPSLVPDIGIMSSSDMVAVERASIDCIKTENLIANGLPSAFPLGEGAHLFEKLHARNPYVQLDELEALGVGKQAYEVREVK